MSLDDIEIEKLVAVLDRLLPAWKSLPAAGQLGLAERVIADAMSWPRGGDALRSVLGELPAEFHHWSDYDQIAALTDVERVHPNAFADIVNLAYNAYYIDDRVQSLLESLTGYAARPPQPRGYDLAAFDQAVVSRARQRQPFWRAAE